MPMRYSINDTVTARCSTVEPGHVRLGPGFVDELARVQVRLLLTPFDARLGDVWTALLARPKDFFCNCSPRPGERVAGAFG